MFDLTGMYIIDPNTGCWNWNESFLSSGYGQIHVGKNSLRAHRIAYIQAKGDIPSNYDVHHKCENKKCINPEHLEAVKHSKHKSLHTRIKCKKGHVFTEESVYIGNDGRRRCKPCAIERSRKQIHF